MIHNSFHGSMNAYIIYNFKWVASHDLIFSDLGFFLFSVVSELGVTFFFCFFLEECINIAPNNNRYDIATVKNFLIKKYKI